MTEIGARRSLPGGSLDLRPLALGYEGTQEESDQWEPKGRSLTTRHCLLRFSNRNIPLLESGLTHCKQTIGARSNRNISRVPQISRGSDESPLNSHESRFTSHSPFATRHCFLLDNGCRVEYDATYRKQRVSIKSTRQWNEAFHKRAERSRNHYYAG